MANVLVVFVAVTKLLSGTEGRRDLSWPIVSGIQSTMVGKHPVGGSSGAAWWEWASLILGDWEAELGGTTLTSIS